MLRLRAAGGIRLPYTDTAQGSIPMAYAGDMIANLSMLPKNVIPENIKLKRALSCDKSRILDFVRERFGAQWADETEYSLCREPQGCFIATLDGRLIGFTCYDAGAKGFFRANRRGRRISRSVSVALLIRTLEAMREEGYGYAVIGWVGEQHPFYEKSVGASYILAAAGHSVYSRLIKM